MSSAPTSVQEAWDSYFKAFRAKDMESILKSYDEASIARVHNNVTGTTEEFEGLPGIRKMYIAIFNDISDMRTLLPLDVKVEEDVKHAFFIWKCTDGGYDTAADTFIFTDTFKIKRQNVVVTKNQVEGVAQGGFGGFSGGSLASALEQAASTERGVPYVDFERMAAPAELEYKRVKALSQGEREVEQKGKVCFVGKLFSSKATFFLERAGPGEVLASGVDEAGVFGLSGRWQEDNTVTLFFNRGTGPKELKLRWDGDALMGTLQPMGHAKIFKRLG